MDSLLDKAMTEPENSICPECKRIMTSDIIKQLDKRNYTTIPFDCEALPICESCEEKILP